MDAKSLARSKRAHSQHQSKKHHQPPKSKSPAIPSSTEDNSKKQTKEKPRQFHGARSKLPSNWDRYEEEPEPGSEAPAIDSGSRVSDVVVPKSKGADFRHLISEAQSQLRSQSSDASESFVSFDGDMLPDFNQGISSILSVRGNSIMSWIGDDNFIVDDKSSASYEASFLSMDLHALAAQLEKVNVSKRLFIEEDLLPPELLAEETKEVETYASGEAEEIIDYEHEVMLSKNASKHDSFFGEGAELMDQETTATTVVRSRISVTSPRDEVNFTNSAEDESNHFAQTNLTDLVDTIDQRNINSVSDSNKKSLPAFKALDAEAELDLLLNSFEQTKLPDSSGIDDRPSNDFPTAKQDDSGFFGASSLRPSQQSLEHVATSSRRSTLTNVNLDDSLDDLLTELSNLKKHEGTPSYTNQKPLGQGPNSSGSVNLSVNIDDTVDDLLAEASNPKKRENSVAAREDKAMITDIRKPSSQSTSKLLDDFDSWLDTI